MRSQDTAHDTHTDTLHTRVHVTISGRTPLSTVGHATQTQVHRWRHGCPAPASGYTETPGWCLSRDSLKSTSFLRPEKQTRRNNKKISLHRFKPIIFSKMIQNCQNQVEGGGYSRLIRERGAPPRREGRRLWTGSLVPASVSPLASLPGPGTTSSRGPQWSPGGGSAGSLSGLFSLFPTGVAEWAAWRAPGVLDRGASLAKPCNRVDQPCIHCLPFTAQRRALIGARQTEDHWKPPDQESVGAKAQDKVSMWPGARSVSECPEGRGQVSPSPTLDARAPSRSRSALCGQHRCSAEQ